MPTSGRQLLPSLLRNEGGPLRLEQPFSSVWCVSLLLEQLRRLLVLSQQRSPRLAIGWWRAWPLQKDPPQEDPPGKEMDWFETARWLVPNQTLLGTWLLQKPSLENRKLSRKEPLRSQRVSPWQDVVVAWRGGLKRKECCWERPNWRWTVPFYVL